MIFELPRSSSTLKFQIIWLEVDWLSQREVFGNLSKFNYHVVTWSKIFITLFEKGEIEQVRSSSGVRTLFWKPHKKNYTKVKNKFAGSRILPSLLLRTIRTFLFAQLGRHKSFLHLYDFIMARKSDYKKGFRLSQTAKPTTNRFQTFLWWNHYSVM